MGKKSKPKGVPVLCGKDGKWRTSLKNACKRMKNRASRLGRREIRSVKLSEQEKRHRNNKA